MHAPASDSLWWADDAPAPFKNLDQIEDMTHLLQNVNHLSAMVKSHTASGRQADLPHARAPINVPLPPPNRELLFHHQSASGAARKGSRYAATAIAQEADRILANQERAISAARAIGGRLEMVEQEIALKSHKAARLCDGSQQQLAQAEIDSLEEARAQVAAQLNSKLEWVDRLTRDHSQLTSSLNQPSVPSLSQPSVPMGPTTEASALNSKPQHRIVRQPH
eukprot:TRINITY_DN17896_c0_g1_i2.p1 TRINITY_DN17896_c0_g1~~TRINITY_DN17896_c0_g1_i2.p1  ORF type:complete len:222 (-),score=26.98 TRINITY_DN17896_c0_g1_i2:1026-1691(-)